MRSTTRCRRLFCNPGQDLVSSSLPSCPVDLHRKHNEATARQADISSDASRSREARLDHRWSLGRYQAEESHLKFFARQAHHLAIEVCNLPLDDLTRLEVTFYDFPPLLTRSRHRRYRRELTGVGVRCICGDKGYRSHNCPDRLKFWITSKVRACVTNPPRDTPPSRRRARDRPSQGRSPHSLEGDRINAVLAAGGYNFGLLGWGGFCALCP
jgi:hypothetical protein